MYIITEGTSILPIRHVHTTGNPKEFLPFYNKQTQCMGYMNRWGSTTHEWKLLQYPQKTSYFDYCLVLLTDLDYYGFLISPLHILTING